jgi:hypothetical protein
MQGTGKGFCCFQALLRIITWCSWVHVLTRHGPFTYLRTVYIMICDIIKLILPFVVSNFRYLALYCKFDDLFKFLFGKGTWRTVWDDLASIAVFCWPWLPHCVSSTYLKLLHITIPKICMCQTKGPPARKWLFVLFSLLPLKHATESTCACVCTLLQHTFANIDWKNFIWLSCDHCSCASVWPDDTSCQYMTSYDLYDSSDCLVHVSRLPLIAS